MRIQETPRQEKEAEVFNFSCLNCSCSKKKECCKKYKKKGVHCKKCPKL